YYETGTGKVVVRGQYTIETLSRGKVNIIFHEMPFQVSAEAIIETIKKRQQNNKLQDIAEVRDLTDKKNGFRLVIETKAGTNYKAVINDLFKETRDEESFNINNIVLVYGRPKKIGVLELLHRFIQFRKECIALKTTHRIEKIDNRLYQLDALLKALVDIDKAIAIIRNSETSQQAKEELMVEFKLE